MACDCCSGEPVPVAVGAPLLSHLDPGAVNKLVIVM